MGSGRGGERVRNVRGCAWIGRRVIDTTRKAASGCRVPCSRGSAQSRAKEVLRIRVGGGEAHGSARERRRVVSGASRARRTLMTLSWNASSLASSVVLTFTNGWSTVSSTPAESTSPVASSSRRHEAAPSMVPARASDAPKPALAPRCSLPSTAERRNRSRAVPLRLVRRRSGGRRRARTEKIFGAGVTGGSNLRDLMTACTHGVSKKNARHNTQSVDWFFTRRCVFQKTRLSREATRVSRARSTPPVRSFVLLKTHNTLRVIRDRSPAREPKDLHLR